MILPGNKDDDDAIAESPAEPTPASSVVATPSTPPVPEGTPAPSGVTTEASNGKKNSGLVCWQNTSGCIDTALNLTKQLGTRWLELNA